MASTVSGSLPLPEQDLPRRFVLGQIEFRGGHPYRQGPDDRWACIQGGDPALHVRELGDVDAAPRPVSDPAEQRHVRDRTLVGDELAILQTLVENAIYNLFIIYKNFYILFYIIILLIY